MEILRHGKYLNLLTDYAFKRIFGSESCKDLLIDFLNEVIEEHGQIINLKYLPTEQLGNRESDRKAIFDIYCQTDCNKHFVVELQKVRQLYFKERSIYYSTFPIQSQAVKGKWNFNLNPVYTVAILDFILFDEKDEEDHFFHSVLLKDDRTNKVFYDKLSYKYIELPKFNRTLEQLNTNFERWIYLLKNLPTFENHPPELRGKVFDRLFEYAEIEKLSQNEMEEYKKSILEYDDIQDAIECAKEIAVKNYKKSVLERDDVQNAIEYAKEIAVKDYKKSVLERDDVQNAIEYAKKIATESGKKEYQNEIIKKCLQRGMSLDEITDLTGLTKPEIQSISLQ